MVKNVFRYSGEQDKLTLLEGLTLTQYFKDMGLKKTLYRAINRTKISQVLEMRSCSTYHILTILSIIGPLNRGALPIVSGTQHCPEGLK